MLRRGKSPKNPKSQITARNQRFGFVEKLFSEYANGKYGNAPVIRLDCDKPSDPFHVLVRCVISQRTRDEQTATVSNRLFEAANTPQEIVALGEKRLSGILRGAGFYRQKAKRIIEICRIVDSSGVPDNIEDLLKLPGVGRKTANIVLNYGFRKPAIAVDVHVHRISNRAGLVKTKTPEETEEALHMLLPRKFWKDVNHVLVAHGQLVCKPIKPLCFRCAARKFCKFEPKNLGK